MQVLGRRNKEINNNANITTYFQVNILLYLHGRHIMYLQEEMEVFIYGNSNKYITELGSNFSV